MNRVYITLKTCEIRELSDDKIKIIQIYLYKNKKNKYYVVTRDTSVSLMYILCGLNKLSNNKNFVQFTLILD